MPKLFNLAEDCLDVLSCREKEEFLLGEEKKGVGVGFKKKLKWTEREEQECKILGWDFLFR